ncbi:MAG: ectonucleotide pyrophosphatase/phosphodiesterase [Pseudomonadota bacterium]
MLTESANHRAVAVRFAPWLLLCAVLLTATSAGARPTVILLSWDGLRHDYPDRATLPALARMARDGARALRLQTVRPSDTFPSHVSLATGTYPDRHGIVGNHFIDRKLGRYSMSSETRWLQAEPLWIAAERQGVPAATYFWVGSEADWRGQGTRYRVAPFDPDRPEADKVAQILAWMALPEAERPGLIMSYWRGADRIGHRFSPDSARVTAQLQAQDAVLSDLLAGLDELDRWDEVTVLLVSDHGMTATGELLPIRTALTDAGIAAQIVGSALAQIFLEDPAQIDIARKVIESVHPAIEVHTGTTLPARWRLQHPERTGDLVVTVPPPFILTGPAGMEGRMAGAMRFFGWRFGGHGYDPALPDMGAAFFALGAGVTPGLTLSTVHVTDVAPTVAHLLGIEPPAQSEGAVIALRAP